ncbi:MAG: TlpA family protein disulfide reductase [Clostridia bacterium]|nr:TlpA family protein disulfide reductase [Clostridia bacterium]
MRRESKSIREVLAWLAALLLLAFALCYFNIPLYPVEVSNTRQALPKTSEDIPFGKEVGNRCPDFTVPMYGEKEEYFSVSEQAGKVTVINFWATWCNPCIAELPYFQKLYDNYGDKVSVIAIHSSMVTDDVPAYLAKQDYTFPFALDETGSVISSLGGSTMLPMTVILDRQGCIVYNAVGSITCEKLMEIVLPLTGGQ